MDVVDPRVERVWGVPPHQVWLSDAAGEIPEDVETFLGGDLHLATTLRARRGDATVDHTIDRWPSFARIAGAGDDVWVVLGADRPAIARWNGRRWSIEPPISFTGIRGLFAAGGRVWIFGDDGLVAARDGREWAPLPSPGEGNVLALWASGPEDVWVGTSAGAVYRWDGAAWHATPGLPGTPVVDLWGAGDRRFAITGEGEVVAWKPDRWGPAHRLVPRVDRFREQLLDLGGTGPDDLWVTSSRGRLYHRIAGDWQRLDTGTEVPLGRILGFEEGEVWLRAWSSQVLRYRPPRS